MKAPKKQIDTDDGELHSLNNSYHTLYVDRYCTLRLGKWFTGAVQYAHF